MEPGGGRHPPTPGIKLRKGDSVIGAVVDVALIEEETALPETKAQPGPFRSFRQPISVAACSRLPYRAVDARAERHRLSPGQSPVSVFRTFVIVLLALAADRRSLEV